MHTTSDEIDLATAVPRLNDWTMATRSTPGQGTISVVIPAHCEQAELDRCLLALEHQRSPIPFEVVVIDHRSPVPLDLPRTSLHVTLRRVDDGSGPGAARAAGALLAEGEVLVFQDVDILPHPDAIWEYASASLQNPFIVTLGFRDFIDPAKFDASSLTEAIQTGNLTEFLTPHQASEGQQWIDDYLAKTDDNREWRDDLWVVVVGAGIGVHRKLYDFAGGFRDFDFHGVEDTEFGWRLFQAGAVIYPNRSARGFHLGLRSISRQRKLINQRRQGTLANRIPHSRYRQRSSPRIWEVPELVVHLILHDDADLNEATRAIDSVLNSELTDFHVVVDTPITLLDAGVLESHYTGDGRVHFLQSGQEILPEASPYLLRLHSRVEHSRKSLGNALWHFRNTDAGLLAMAAGEDSISVELWRTAALARARLASEMWGLNPSSVLRHAFDEIWLPGSDFDFHVARSS